MKQAARDLDVGESVLRRWVRWLVAPTTRDILRTKTLSRSAPTGQLGYAVRREVNRLVWPKNPNGGRWTKRSSTRASLNLAERVKNNRY